MNSISVIDGVQITDDGETMHFESVDRDENSLSSQIDDSRSIWQKMIDWWKSSNIVPYVKLRNLSKPVDSPTNTEEGGKRGIEAGIKISF